MTPYLRTHPPARSQFRSPRREKPSGVCVVHTAENAPDTVATDGGAEAVANWIRIRPDPGSYHDLCDSDSIINVVDYGDEAFHDATGSNRHSYGVSAATTAAFWPLAPRGWRDRTVENMAQAAARYARWVKTHYGVTVPAKRITRAQSEARVPGFLAHGDRDPARRTDPGIQFPWDQFLARFAELMGYTTPPKPTPKPKELFTVGQYENIMAALRRIEEGVHVDRGRGKENNEMLRRIEPKLRDLAVATPTEDEVEALLEQTKTEILTALGEGDELVDPPAPG